LWIGISADEVLRAKPAQVPIVVNSFPLLARNYDRRDCSLFLDSLGWTAPKSSCIFCPFRHDDNWRALDEDEMQFVIEVDERIRNVEPRLGPIYLHHSGVPLKDVDWNAPRVRRNIMDMECEGMCGV
jgi:hypothetical protein